jgi:hypothetical protein
MRQKIAADAGGRHLPELEEDRLAARCAARGLLERGIDPDASVGTTGLSSRYCASRKRTESLTLCGGFARTL